MLDYTLENVIDFINDEINEAYESAYCDDIVEGVIDAYDNGVITYEEADDYLSLMTEARRLDKEILRKAELIDKLDKFATDSTIPPSIREKIYNKYKDDRYLSSSSGEVNLPLYRIKQIADAYKKGEKYRNLDDNGKAQKKTDKDSIAEKLKELKDIEKKKVNTKVKPRDPRDGAEL